ncbi:hypothetical protein K2X85_08800 [bacterium]|nr:hypothetical protein [bacterium]
MFADRLHHRHAARHPQLLRFEMTCVRLSLKLFGCWDKFRQNFLKQTVNGKSRQAYSDHFWQPPLLVLATLIHLVLADRLLAQGIMIQPQFAAYKFTAGSFRETKDCIDGFFYYDTNMTATPTFPDSDKDGAWTFISNNPLDTGLGAIRNELSIDAGESYQVFGNQKTTISTAFAPPSYDRFNPNRRVWGLLADSEYDNTSYGLNVFAISTTTVPPLPKDLQPITRQPVAYGPRNYSGFRSYNPIDRSKNDEMVINSFSKMQPRDIFDGSLEVDVAGHEISVYFRAFQGAMRPDQAAHLLGFEHFNFVNKIVSVPDSWSFRVFDQQTGGSIGDDLSLPYLDPDYQYFPNLVGIYDEDAGFAERIDTTGIALDRLPYYYRNDDNDHLNRQGVNYFYDAPRVPEEFLVDGEFWQFETDLIGVRSDGSMVDLKGFAPTIRWKSNAVYDSENAIRGGIVTSVPEGDLPAIVSGGVYDVEVVYVPEVSSFVLQSCVMAMTVMAYGWRSGLRA